MWKSVVSVGKSVLDNPLVYCTLKKSPEFRWDPFVRLGPIYSVGFGYFVITDDETLKSDISVGKSVVDNPIPHVGPICSVGTHIFQSKIR